MKFVCEVAVYTVCMLVLYIQSVCWCCRLVGPVCTESERVSNCVTCFVVSATAYNQYVKH